MSYDVSILIDIGGPEAATVYDCGNYTYNVSGMFYKAIGAALELDKNADSVGLNQLSGYACQHLIPILERAITHMTNTENLSEYKAMEPKNGWGTYEGAVLYLQKILNGCKSHPKGFIEVC